MRSVFSPLFEGFCKQATRFPNVIISMTQLLTAVQARIRGLPRGASEKSPGRTAATTIPREYFGPIAPITSCCQKLRACSRARATSLAYASC